MSLSENILIVLYPGTETVAESHRNWLQVPASSGKVSKEKRFEWLSEVVPATQEDAVQQTHQGLMPRERFEDAELFKGKIPSRK